MMKMYYILLRHETLTNVFSYIISELADFCHVPFMYRKRKRIPAKTIVIDQVKRSCDVPPLKQPVAEVMSYVPLSMLSITFPSGVTAPLIPIWPCHKHPRGNFRCKIATITFPASLHS